ncbi:hypothetical protein VTN96DRAFT_10451 [Rasamsonia emersonii]
MGIWNVRGRLSVTANITGSQQCSLATSFGDSRIAWNRPSETESGPLFMVMTALQVSIIVSTHVIGTHSPHFFFCDQTSSDRNSLLA